MSEQPQDSPTMAYVMIGLVVACWAALLITGASLVGIVALAAVTVLVGVILYQRFRK